MAKKEGDTLLTALQDKLVHLECVVCQEFLESPKGLDCGHVFCEGCVMRLWKKQKSIPCPTCRKETKKDPNDIPTVWMVKTMVESLKAAICAVCKEAKDNKQLCVHCQRYLCAECLVEHVNEVKQDLRMEANTHQNVKSLVLEKAQEAADLEKQIKKIKDTAADLTRFYDDTLSNLPGYFDDWDELMRVRESWKKIVQQGTTVCRLRDLAYKPSFVLPDQTCELRYQEKINSQPTQVKCDKTSAYNGVTFNQYTGEIMAASRSGYICRYALDGHHIHHISVPEPRGQAKQATDLISVAVINEARIVASDEANAQAVILNNSGTIIKRFGSHGEGPGQFRSPNGIGCGWNKIYVADEDRDNVQMFTTDGEYIGQLKCDVKSPARLTCSREHRLIAVAEYGNDQVLLFDERTESAVRRLDRNIRGPTGIVFDNFSNNLITCESTGKKIQVFSMDGQPIETLRDDRQFFGISLAPPNKIVVSWNIKQNNKVQDNGIMII